LILIIGAPLNKISQKQITEIKKSIDAALEDGAEPIAAFDADGTLWDMDMGETFFDYQVQKKLLPNLPKDPWDFYHKLHDKDEPTAFLWLAQINNGRPQDEVRTWAKAAFDDLKKVPVFDNIREIIQHLQKNKVQVYIVTASIKWAVEPGAEFLGIPKENVIGVATKVINGLITDKLDGVITWREGKVAGLLNATQKKHAFMAAGNTLGDLALLESATHVRLVNTASAPDSRIYDTEQKLVEVAIKRNWFCHTHTNL
jgi:phosphoserine phosphatase